tara:strand:- start:4884 stop:5114 length:231 start_codon:yes stop_codon:yes gene_type:complete
MAELIRLYSLIMLPADTRHCIPVHDGILDAHTLARVMEEQLKEISGFVQVIPAPFVRVQPPHTGVRHIGARRMGDN